MFQITLHKNLNQFHRVEGVPSHSSLFFTPEKTPVYVPSSLHLVKVITGSNLAFLLVSSCKRGKERRNEGSKTRVVSGRFEGGFH